MEQTSSTDDELLITERGSHTESESVSSLSKAASRDHGSEQEQPAAGAKEGGVTIPSLEPDTAYIIS
jgi:hypothetical protein